MVKLEFKDGPVYIYILIPASFQEQRLVAANSCENGESYEILGIYEQ